MDPRKALEEIKELSPHLIITDIKMPHMDGLEFSTKAKKLLPNVEIVILSGHDDFIFAQTAMKLGVSDYLLKPIKKKDFENMLLTMHRKIDHNLNVEEQFETLRNITLSNYSILRNKFFSLIIEGGSILDPIIKNLYNQLGFCFANHNFILVKFVIHEISVKDDYISTMNKLIHEFMGHIQSYGFVEEFYTNEYLYFYLYDIDIQSFSLEDFTKNILQYTKKKNHEGLKLLVGLSQIHSSIYNLFFAVSECDEFIVTEDKTTSDNISIYRAFSEDSNLYFPYSEIESLFLAIFSKDEKKVLDSIETILDLTNTSIYKDFSYSIVMILMIRMCHIQNKYGAKYNIITNDLLKIELLKQRYPTPIKLKNLILDKANEIADLINSQSVAAASKTILAAIQYIENNFNKNISLSDVAQHIHISKNYLCDLFKKELNITFIDYVTNLRIEKGKYYLSHTDMKMYEISAAVGYNDYAYFSQIFKKHVGVSLSNYRKHH